MIIFLIAPYENMLWAFIRKALTEAFLTSIYNRSFHDRNKKIAARKAGTCYHPTTNRIGVIDSN